MAAKRGRPSKKDGLSAIYVLRCPDSGDVRYVGKAKDPAKRMETHLWSGRGQRPVVCWVRALRAAGKRPVMEVVEWAADWEACEQRWIAAHRAEGARLLNVAAGGLDMVPAREGAQRLPAYAWAMRFCGERKNATLATLIRSKMDECKAHGDAAALAFDAVLRDAVVSVAPGKRVPGHG